MYVCGAFLLEVSTSSSKYCHNSDILCKTSLRITLVLALLKILRVHKPTSDFLHCFYGRDYRALPVFRRASNN